MAKRESQVANYQGLPDCVHSLTIRLYCLLVLFAQAEERGPSRPKREDKPAFTGP